jgi:hypothetical protein
VKLYIKITNIKERHINKKRFRGILDEFPLKFNNFKKLAEKLRRILFPIRDESLFTGTYRNPEKLYKLIIDTFNRIIARYTENKLDIKE